MKRARNFFHFLMSDFHEVANGALREWKKKFPGKVPPLTIGVLAELECTNLEELLDVLETARKDQALQEQKDALWEVVKGNIRSDVLKVTWENYFAGQWTTEKVTELQKWSPHQWSALFPGVDSSRGEPAPFSLSPTCIDTCFR